MSGRFVDRNVLITGAGSGIGQAAAILFAKEGGQIVAEGCLARRAKDRAVGVYRLPCEAALPFSDRAKSELSECGSGRAGAEF